MSTPKTSSKKTPAPKAPAPRPDAPSTKALRSTFAFPSTAEKAAKLKKYLEGKKGKPVTRNHLAKTFHISKPWVDRLLVLTGAKRLAEAVRENAKGKAADGFVL